MINCLLYFYIINKKIEKTNIQEIIYINIHIYYRYQ